MPDLPGALRRLLPFPPVAARLLSILAGPNPAVRDVVDLIQSDPALATEMLATANSPLFGPTAEIRTVAHAATFLGFARVTALVSTTAMRQMARGQKTAPMRNCWLHSMATALIASELGRFRGIHPDSAYTAGLLHDLGRFGFLAAYPDPYGALVLARHESVPDILDAERAIAGVDHSEAGLMLATLWNLPEPFPEVAARHHDKHPADEVTELIRTACLLADTLRFEAVRYQQVPTFQDVIAPSAAKADTQPSLTVEELEERIVERVYCLDSV